MRSLLALLFVVVVVPSALAQDLCGVRVGVGGGVVESDRGARLSTHLAAPVAGTVTSARGAVLRAKSVPCAVTTATAVEAPVTVHRTQLGAIAPNPFNPRARVRFEIATEGPVRLDVYDTAGRHVRTLVDATLAAGVHVRALDGAGLASGVYHVRLAAGGTTEAASVVLLK